MGTNIEALLREGGEVSGTRMFVQDMHREIRMMCHNASLGDCNPNITWSRRW